MIYVQLIKIFLTDRFFDLVTKINAIIDFLNATLLSGKLVLNPGPLIVGTDVDDLNNKVQINGKTRIFGTRSSYVWDPTVNSSVTYNVTYTANSGAIEERISASTVGWQRYNTTNDLIWSQKQNGEMDFARTSSGGYNLKMSAVGNSTEYRLDVTGSNLVVRNSLGTAITTFTNGGLILTSLLSGTTGSFTGLVSVLDLAAGAVTANSASIAGTVFANAFNTTASTSITTNGYTRLTNGTILQWGFITNTYTEGSTFTITFPLTFPNNCFTVLLTTMNSDAPNDRDTWVQLVSRTNSTFTFFPQFDGGGNNAITGITYMAIGN